MKKWRPEPTLKNGANTEKPNKYYFMDDSKEWELKLKDKSTIYFYQDKNYSDKECQWCGKTIKEKKQKFYITDKEGRIIDDYYFCSLAHLKAKANSKI